MNVEVEMLSSSSVRVSWDSIDIPEITNYTVYYRKTGNGMGERSMTVPSSTNSVVIEGLMSNVQYQFQVVALIVEGNVVVMGRRSLNSIAVMFACTYSTCYIMCHIMW